MNSYDVKIAEPYYVCVSDMLSINTSQLFAINLFLM